MRALFVHGMGRSPLSAAPLLWRLKQSGISPLWFFYTVTFQSFQSIEARLRQRIITLANSGEYVLIGHSLGGVLIRGALGALPAGTRLPSHVFLLGSPVRHSRVAKFFSRNWLFWLATRDCGQLLSSAERMQSIAPCQVPTTVIVGTHGLYGRLSPFGDEINDGIVAASEVAPTWAAEEVRVRVLHTTMPSNRQVSQVVIERIAAVQANSHNREIVGDGKVE